MRISRRPRHLGHPSAVTIGSFDGVHRGHQQLVQALKTQAAERGLTATVVTFEPQPREYFDPNGAPARLSALNDKVRRLAELGVDHLVVLPFNAELRSMSAARFVDQVLIDGLDARWVEVGDDFVSATIAAVMPTFYANTPSMWRKCRHNAWVMPGSAARLSDP